MHCPMEAVEKVWLDGMDKDTFLVFLIEHSFIQIKRMGQNDIGYKSVIYYRDIENEYTELCKTVIPKIQWNF